MLKSVVQNVAYMNRPSKASLKERKRILKSKRGSVVGIAAELGIAPQTVSQWLAGRVTSARIADAVEKECRRIQRSHK